MTCLDQKKPRSGCTVQTKQAIIPRLPVSQKLLNLKLANSKLLIENKTILRATTKSIEIQSSRKLHLRIKIKLVLVVIGLKNLVHSRINKDWTLTRKNTIVSIELEGQLTINLKVAYHRVTSKWEVRSL